MAGKKSKSSGAISNGGRQKAHEAQEAKRQAYFKERRENKNNYVYKPNPYKPGTSEYEHERLERHEKALASRRLPYAWNKHVFAQLDNWLEKQTLKEKAQQKK